MAKARILLVDDAVVIRRLVADVLNRDPALEVVGTAASGRIALAKIPQVNPDLVTLDMEMPEMDGLQTLTEIRKTYPTLPVIMFSTLTARGAAATLDALRLGANDYVTKPANVGSVAVAIERVREELIPKIKAFCAKVIGPVPAVRPAWTGSAAPPPASPKAPRRVHRIDLVAIGCSTGGPNALATLVPELPAELPVPVLIVQHMPPVFTRSLAERLHAQSKIAVKEAAPGDSVEAGHAYLAPGDYHLVVDRQALRPRLRTHQGPPENSCRPAVDVLFRSAVQSYGPGVLAVVLTGMGQDGLRGCETIHEAGGQVVVQDEATSIVWGMPGFVARAGLADRILPLEQIAGEIVRRVTSDRRAPAASTTPLTSHADTGAAT
jgi:two-component system chemotaxis response regulator CheB